MILRKSAYFLLLAATLSCRPGATAPGQTGTGETDGYRLVWADYFDEGRLDADKWTCERNADGGGNAELQFYQEENVSVGKDPADGRGCLQIRAVREHKQEREFTSGRLNTSGKYEFTYGKVEASIKLPSTADGLWPAFWLLGADYKTNRWPLCGEIDILEMGNADGISAGNQDRYFNGACHWGSYEGSWHPEKAVHSLAGSSLQDGRYHLFTLEWEPESIRMYLDKDVRPDAEPYFELDISKKESPQDAGNYFHHDHFIIFNMAVGGIFTGIFDPAAVTALRDKEAVMYVDFVKVYQKQP